MKRKGMLFLLVFSMLICSFSFLGCENADKSLITSTQDLISALPSIENLKYEDKSKISEALEKYNALSEENKSKVDVNLVTKLTDSDKKIAEWTLILDNAKTAIQNLPAEKDYTEAKKEELQQAKKAFDALSQDLASHIDSALKEKLNGLLKKQNDIVLVSFYDSVDSIGSGANDVYLLNEIATDLNLAKENYKLLNETNKALAEVKAKKAILDEMVAEYDRLVACSAIDDLVISKSKEIFTDETCTLLGTFTNPESKYSCVFTVEKNDIGAKVDNNIFSSVLPGKVKVTGKVDFGKSITISKTLEIEIKGVAISGEINAKYPTTLNDIAIKLLCNEKEIKGAVTAENNKFTYSISSPRNANVKVVCSAVNFTVSEQNLKVEAENLINKNFELNNYSITSLVGTGSWSFSDGAYTVGMSSVDCYHYAGFDGQVKDTYKLDATISNCSSGVKNGEKLVYTYGLLLTGTPANKTAIVFQSNDGGDNWRICSFNISSWGNKSFVSDNSITAELKTKLKSVYFGGSIDVSVIRVQSMIYLFVDNNFIGSCQIGVGENGFKADNGSYPSLPNDAHLFGFFTRGGNGATYSNVNIDYVMDNINNSISKTIAVNKIFGENDKYGSIELVGAENNKIEVGKTLTVNITPTPSSETQINTITKFNVNGVNMINKLVGKNGIYSIDLVVSDNLVIDTEIQAEFSGRVSGKVTIEGAFGKLADLEKVMVGNNEATLNKEIGDYTILLPISNTAIEIKAFHKYMNTATVTLDNLSSAGAVSNLALSGMGYDDIGNTKNWSRTGANSFTVGLNTGDNQQFIGIKGSNESNVWSFESTISSVMPSVVNNINVYCYGVLISGDAGQKASLVMQRNGTEAWAIKALNFSKWANTDFVPASVAQNFTADLDAPCNGGEVKLKVIRDLGSIFLYINDKYVGTVTLKNGSFWANTTPNDGHLFGCYTRASNGATFTNVNYSFDKAIIRKELANIAIQIDQNNDGAPDMGLINVYSRNGSLCNFKATKVGEKNGYVSQSAANFVGKIVGSETSAESDFVMTVTLNYNTTKSEKHGIGIGFSDKEINFTLENTANLSQPRTYVVAFPWSNLKNKYVLGSAGHMAGSTNASVLSGSTEFLSDVNTKAVVMRLVKQGNVIYQFMKLSTDTNWGIIGKLNFVTSEWGSGEMYLGLSNIEGSGCAYTDISYSYDSAVIAGALTDIPA